MTVQLPVVIWTVVNFLILFAVLHFLLFKPMLKTMDARGEKVRHGREIEARRRAAVQAEEEELVAFFAKRETLLEQKTADGITLAKEQCRYLCENAQADHDRRVAQERAALVQEEEELKKKLDDALPTLSDAAVKRLLEKGL